MPQNKKYTAVDFERYHSGKMNESEMHSLEKAALEDSFLADALEGYTYTDAPEKDITELKGKLLAKKKKKNILFINQKENIWLRVAAIFILIAGMGYLAYILNFNKENTTLAKKQDNNFKTETEQHAIVKNDSLTDSKKEDVAANSPIEKKNGSVNKDINKIPEADRKISQEHPVAKTEKPAPGYLQKAAPASSAIDEVAIKDKDNIVTGKIIDSAGNPVRFATVMDRNKKINTTTDSAGRFKLMLKDTSLAATIAAAGYKTKQTRLRDKREQVIVMETDNQALNEVVVTASGMQRQKRDVNYAPKLKARAAQTSVNNLTSEPVTGWQKFNEYIRGNINIPEDKEGKSYKGKAVLSFEINRNGNPKNIKVEQSLCAPCDEEAIRLLVSGPKWKFIKNKRQIVTIEF